ncbi:hypothetical protein OAP63_06565 [Vibrio sp.]|uniref:Uncharacterized protein n=1 Tax=Vibrio viridaestus TaxID=2487322 RepID=A0A3N9TIZ1_9VIBR|nr:hypothetical protein [Vibrio viridaestus]MDC0610379.1 hypothetical protein [Vibrio sp.]RQW64298.1 hypothetical protein EES38_06880 [Vibrio viridaestus]
MGFTNIYIHKGCDKSLVNKAIKSNGAGRIKFKAKGVEQQGFILQAIEGISDETVLLIGFGVGPHWSQHTLDVETLELLQKQNTTQIQKLLEIVEKNRLNIICVNPMKNKEPVKSLEDIVPFGCTSLLRAGDKTFCIGKEAKQLIRNNPA